MSLARSGFGLRRKGGARGRGWVRDPHLSQHCLRSALDPTSLLPSQILVPASCSEPVERAGCSISMLNGSTLPHRGPRSRLGFSVLIPGAPSLHSSTTFRVLESLPRLLGSTLDCPPRMEWKLEPASNSWVCLRELYSGEAPLLSPSAPH